MTCHDTWFCIWETGTNILETDYSQMNGFMVGIENVDLRLLSMILNIVTFDDIPWHFMMWSIWFREDVYVCNQHFVQAYFYTYKSTTPDGRDSMSQPDISFYRGRHSETDGRQSCSAMDGRHYYNCNHYSVHHRKSVSWDVNCKNSLRVCFENQLSPYRSPHSVSKISFYLCILFVQVGLNCIHAVE